MCCVLTGEAVVVAVGQVVVEHDGNRVEVVLKLLPQVANLVLWDLKTGPAIPLESGRFGETAQAADESSGGHAEIVLALV